MKTTTGIAIAAGIVGTSFLLAGCSTANRATPSRGVRPASAENERPTDNPAMRLVLLGTGTPNADPQRSGPASAIVVNSDAYLVDCGPGIVRRAAAAHERGITALAMPNLKRVFLTHLHSDHTLGLPDLIFSPWVLERTEPLHVYGPPGTAAMVRHIEQAWSEDVRIRIEGLEPANDTGHRTVVYEVEPGMVYHDLNVKVTAFPVIHGECRHAFGYRFDSADRSIVFSGDTVPCESLVEAARGCDVLVHEVYSSAGFAGRPPEWQTYHAASHTSSTQLGQIAVQVKPRLLVLYHQLFWGTAEAELVAEVKRHYDGEVVSGKDLEVY